MTRPSRTLALALLAFAGVASPQMASAHGGAAAGSATVTGGASTADGARGASSVATAGPEGLADADRERAAGARDRGLDEAATLTGGVGLLHTQHAQGGAPGQFRLAFTTEFFSTSFLCSAEFPCRHPDDPTQAITRDGADHVGGRLTLSMQFTRWLETYLATSAFANSNAANRPTLIQALGDGNLGAKAHGALSDVFHVGGAAELWLINGTGSLGLDGAGTSAKLRGLATADLRGARRPLPLRFSTNVTYVLDNSGEVVADVERRRAAPVTRIERFGLNFHRVDHVDVHLGGELFLLEDRIRPLVEYQLLLPFNRQGYRCREANPSGDGCLVNEALVPSTLTVGSRFFPWRRGFNVTAAMDIGITGVRSFIEELRPTAPWMLYVGAGWAFDTQEPPPRVVVERVVEAAPVGQRIRGRVHAEGSTEPIANAIVAWEGRPELTSLATGADGSFTTHGLPPGHYAFTIRAEDYEPGTCAATVPGAVPAGQPPQGGGAPDVPLDCALRPLPLEGSVTGVVRDADTKQLVPGAAIRVIDGAGNERRGASDPEGAFRFDRLQPGELTLVVEADGHLVTSMRLDLKAREPREVEIRIPARPKESLVSVEGEEIVIRQQVAFGLNSAQILPASTDLLAEIADTLHKHPGIRRVEVQGHTDASGTPAHNLKLSEERARAVVTWLVGRGIAPERLSPKGYGDTKPLVPNVTNANRQRNRRVQLMIIEQGAASEQGGPNPAVR